MSNSVSNNSISKVDGFYAKSTRCGVKTYGDGPDLGVIYCPEAVGSAAVFTRNLFRAPSVSLTEASVKAGHIIKAVVANSGNANAGTGEAGKEAAETTRSIAAELLGLTTDEVAIASTGRVSEKFPTAKVTDALRDLLPQISEPGDENFADAILTTDLTRKVSWHSGNEFNICGVCKGSGMIAPSLATMLMFIATDADLNSDTLQKILEQNVDETLNMLSVDTDTSTSDMVVLISSGKNKTSADDFDLALKSVLVDLTEQLATDGEGATKLIRVKTTEARDKTEARSVSKSIVDSPLVKTAIYGEDPNWGRILMAAGKAEGASFDPAKVNLVVNGKCLLSDGEDQQLSREELKPAMQKKEIDIEISLCNGKASSIAWGCDLTHKYVDINVEYT